MKVTKQVQKEWLKSKLSTDEVWAKKALLKIYENQTDFEQRVKSTCDYNNIGFTGVDGKILSSLSEQLIKRGSLSPKQMDIVMKKMTKYWKQILSISDVDKLNSIIAK